MNYRHAFHAGNFADLVKHAALTSLMARLGSPLQVLDTHAGAGLYDLGGEMARKSGEGEAAVRLMADAAAPAVFAPLKAVIGALNPNGGVRLYPGSPVIAVRRLAAGDSYAGYELRPDDHGLLAKALADQRSRAAVRAEMADGYAAAAQIGRGPGRRLVLIDPPFERADDYDQVVRATASILRRDRRACVAVWLPLKDLNTFDRFVGSLEDLEPPSTSIVETRLRPLHDPLKMNGCALIVVGAPLVLDDDLRAASDWVVRTLGQAGGETRLWRVGEG